MTIRDSRCMCLCSLRQPLVERHRQLPAPGPNEVVLRVRACGVCRTDLHVIDGELPDQPLPIVPGHEIVGDIVERGSSVTWPLGARVGVPWLGHTCGTCEYCTSGRENLCDQARFVGYQIDGGYAEHVLADARYCFELPPSLDDAHAAPLLCAGLIGYRAWRMTGPAHRLGLFGFGAAAHLVSHVARVHGQEVYAFTRPGDLDGQRFALEQGAHWAGDTEAMPPESLDAAIIFAPAGNLVPMALQQLRKGGTLVCGGIHMSDIPAMPYSLLWGERVIRSVANLTRRDGVEFLRIAAAIPLKPTVQVFALDAANEALDALRAGALRGAAVLVP